MKSLQARLWATLFVILLCCTSIWASFFCSRPVLIAHRGSPCSHPEETIASYEVQDWLFKFVSQFSWNADCRVVQEALRQGADYLEFDLVATKDGKLVLRHDATLDDSTNVLDLAASGSIMQSSATRQLEPGKSSVTGYFVTDFSLQELKALTAVQPFAFRTAELNSGAKIAAISDIFALFKTSWNNQSSAGLYMELKHPQYHADLGKDMPKLLMEEILRAGITPAQARSFVVQCFDLESLQQFSRHMKEEHFDIPLLLLVDCEQGLPDLDTMRTVKALSAEAGIGPDKSLLLATKGTPECGNSGQDVCKSGASGKHNGNCIGRLQAGHAQLPPSYQSPQRTWVEQAHSLGLVVHAWTDRYMAIDFRGDSHLEMDALMSETAGLGIDGVFIDCPVSASRWRKAFVSQDLSAAATEAKSSRITAVAAQDEDVDDVEVEPAAAITTYVIVAVLIAACGLYAWISNQGQVAASVHGPYKVMTSPRVGDDGDNVTRNSQRCTTSETLEVQ